MTDLVPVRRALLSVSDKTDLVPFAKGLRDLGVEIVSTGGTARALAEAGVDIVAVDDVTGVPEMMDGRVKTLHPRIHGGLLARRDDDAHVSAMTEHGIPPIDLVCVNLYPFEETVARGGANFDETIEQIDIGGPAVLRSGSKNHAFVTVVTSPRQYDRVISELRANEGCTTIATRRELAAAAFTRTAAYDTAIATWMSTQVTPADGDEDAGFPSILQLGAVHERPLRYGENPHQRAALYRLPGHVGPSVATARVLHGKPLSYNNLLDAAAALRLVGDLHLVSDERPSAAIVKHQNPCGAATADTLADAFAGAWAGDPQAAFGGILAFDGPVDAALAEAVTEGQRFLEVIVAPGFAEEAVTILGARWKNVRLLDVRDVERREADPRDVRSIPGGLLVQQRDESLANPDTWRHVAGPRPGDAALRQAVLAWTTVKHLSSNAVCLVAGGRLVGAGAGQVDRVGACRIAVDKASRVERAGEPIAAASDAFFPFPDGPEILIDGGATLLVHPGGSVRDEETIALCRERNVTCMLTGVRHFRH